MNPSLIIALIMAAMAGYAGIYHLMRYLLMREWKEDLAFSLSCFSMFFYGIISAGLYWADSPAEGAVWQKSQMTALCANGVFIMQFVSAFIHRKRRVLDYVFSGIWIFEIVVSLLGVPGWMWTDEPSVKRLQFLGQLVTYNEMKPGNLMVMGSIAMVSAFIYIIVSLVWYARRENEAQKVKPVLVGSVGLFAGFLNDMAVSAGLYPGPYLIELAYVVMILCMAYSLLSSQIRTRIALQQSEENYRSFLSEFQGIAFRADLGMKLHFIHGDVERITGYREAEFLAGNPPWTDIIHPEDRAAREAILAAIEPTIRYTAGREYRIIRKDGTVRWVYELIHSLPARTRKSVYLHGMLHDITERKQTEDELKRLAEAVNAAAESIVITDAEDRILYVNPSCEALTGFSRSELLGKTPSLFKSGKHDRGFYAELRNTLDAGRVWRGHFVNRRKDGSLYEEDAVISPIRDSAGKIANFVAVKRDVTQEVMLENELRQSQKMDAIGQLAGRVAHDFTNILVIIQGNAGLIKDSLPVEHETREYLESIIDAANRACKLTSQLLAFSHRQPMFLRNVDLNKAVRGGVEEMLQRTVGEGVHLSIHTPPGVNTVRADPDLIEQVVVHLSVNACDVMPNGGFLTIETDRVVLSADEVVQLQRGMKSEDRPAGGFAVLYLSDSGCGMSPEVQSHVFEPFFTTKGGGMRSTGLGLATVYGIVEQQKACITVYSREGMGTTFGIFIPLIGRGKKEAEDAAQAEERRGGKEAILVVEVDPVPRGVLVRALLELGYAVLEAEDVRQAVGLIQENQGRIRLLIVDRSVMSTASKETVDGILEKGKALRVLYTSGFPRNHLVEQKVIGPEEPLLTRPFRIGDISRTVRRVLDA